MGYSYIILHSAFLVGYIDIIQFEVLLDQQCFGEVDDRFGRNTKLVTARVPLVVVVCIDDEPKAVATGLKISERIEWRVP